MFSPCLSHNTYIISYPGFGCQYPLGILINFVDTQYPLVVVFLVEFVISQQDVVDALEQGNQPRDSRFREQKIENAPSRLPKVELVYSYEAQEERQQHCYPAFASHIHSFIFLQISILRHKHYEPSQNNNLIYWTMLLLEIHYYDTILRPLLLTEISLIYHLLSV